MNVAFTDQAWADLMHWLEHDRTILKKIVRLVEDIRRHPFEGIGKPEPLRFRLSGYWSRRITLEHRLVYAVEGDLITIVAARNHYE